jgi:hypothetical protein
MRFMGFRPAELFNAAAEVLEGVSRRTRRNKFAFSASWAALGGAIAIGTAPKGNLAANAVGAVIGEGGAMLGSGFGAIAGEAIGGAVGSLAGPLGTAVGVAIGGTIGSIVGGIKGYNTLYDSTANGIIAATKAAKASLHYNIGGNYKDTTIASTMRQRAASEMSGSLLNARMWLGQEARLSHT